MFLKIGLALIFVQITVHGQLPCTRDRLQAAPDSGCKQFQICGDDGTWSMPRDCVPGTLFDEVQQRCEHEVNATCTQLARSITGCTPGPVQASQCHDFTLCVDGIPYTFTCGEILVYSSTLRVCNWPNSLTFEERQFCGIPIP